MRHSWEHQTSAVAPATAGGDADVFVHQKQQQQPPPAFRKLVLRHRGDHLEIIKKRPAWLLILGLLLCTISATTVAVSLWLVIAWYPMIYVVFLAFSILLPIAFMAVAEATLTSWSRGTWRLEVGPHRWRLHGGFMGLVMPNNTTPGMEGETQDLVDFISCRMSDPADDNSAGADAARAAVAAANDNNNNTNNKKDDHFLQVVTKTERFALPIADSSEGDLLVCELGAFLLDVQGRHRKGLAPKDYLVEVKTVEDPAYASVPPPAPSLAASLRRWLALHFRVFIMRHTTDRRLEIMIVPDGLFRLCQSFTFSACMMALLVWVLRLLIRRTRTNGIILTIVLGVFGVILILLRVIFFGWFKHLVLRPNGWHLYHSGFFRNRRMKDCHTLVHEELCGQVLTATAELVKARLCECTSEGGPSSVFIVLDHRVSRLANIESTELLDVHECNENEQQWILWEINTFIRDMKNPSTKMVHLRNDSD